MNLQEALLGAGGGSLVRELSRQVGLGEGDTRNAIEHLVPALSRGLGRNAAGSDGLDALLGALKSGNHQRYVDHPEDVGRAESIADGNAILGHILGSKEVSRNVAGRAASETGLDSGLLKKLLPMVAAAAMGSLGKEVSGGGSLGSLSGGQGGAGSPGLQMLESFLDSDRDGSVLDDVLGMAKKFF